MNKAELVQACAYLSATVYGGDQGDDRHNYNGCSVATLEEVLVDLAKLVYEETEKRAKVAEHNDSLIRDLTKKLDVRDAHIKDLFAERREMKKLNQQ